MPHAEFIHLRVHTAYSLAEGAIHVKDLVKLSVNHGMPAVGMTDTGNLFGALEFSEAAWKAGVQPIVGCALAITRADAPGRDGRRPEPDRLVFLAQSEAGYGNLLKLVSQAFLETPPGETPQVAMAALAQHAAGLICLTGGAGGPLGRLLLEGQRAAAEQLLGELDRLFPGRLYVELQRHGTPEEARTEAGFLELAYARELPLVATNEPYFAISEMYEAHDALICIAEGAYVSQPKRRRLTPEHHFKSAKAMRELFADLPEAVDNTVVVARRCAFRVPERKPILPSFSTEAGRDEAAELKAQAEQGLETRLAAQLWKPEHDAGVREALAKPYRERLAFELKVITDMKFPGYFLIVADFIKWAKARGIPVGPGRGSGAGSVVAWALTITDLDPLRFGLLFERFLNPERVSMPDFDIDFCQDRRDEVIRYVQDKYGHDQVAQIITFGKLQARAVLRDVGRVLEMPYGQVDRLCKLVPQNPANPVTLAQAIEGEPRLQAAREEDEQVRRLLGIAQQLEGLYRHASTHAAGLVIGDRPLDKLVPLYRDPRSSMPVTQFSMKYVEAAGLVKFDFLGLKTLTVLDRGWKLLKERGIDVDPANLALDDRATYELLSRGDTVGVFQLEGSGMRDMLRKFKPDRFEDIIAIVALYRPGPMDNIPRFIACKHGTEQPDYLYPSLKPLLEETYGVIVYQEQVMQIAQILSGYSLGEADLLRRAMGKKIKAEMDAQKARFIDGAKGRGVAAATADHIFELVAKFAGYGFNKSHAAAYALVAYHTAWMKANHPVEFLAASMSLDLGNTDKLNVFRQELARLRIPLRKPDINRSAVEFAVEHDEEAPQGAVRYALAAVKGVGPQAMADLVGSRAREGAFRDLWEFSRRVDPKTVNKRMLEALVKAGAFDQLNGNRAQSFAAIETLLRHAGAAAEERESNQVSLFGDAEPAARQPLPAVAEWLPADRLRHEFEAIGFYLSAHPLDEYTDILKKQGVLPYAQIAAEAMRRGGVWKLGGTVLGRQERRSAKGNRFAFVQLSDPSGVYEITVFSELLSACRELLEPGQSLMLTVEARADGDGVRFTTQSIEPVEKVAEAAMTNLKVYLSDERPIEGIRSHLKNGLSGAVKGRCEVMLIVTLPRPMREVEVKLPGRFAVSPQLRAAIKATPGVEDVRAA